MPLWDVGLILARGNKGIRMPFRHVGVIIPTEKYPECPSNSPSLKLVSLLPPISRAELSNPSKILGLTACYLRGDLGSRSIFKCVVCWNLGIYSISRRMTRKTSGIYGIFGGTVRKIQGFTAFSQNNPAHNPGINRTQWHRTHKHPETH